MVIQYPNHVNILVAFAFSWVSQTPHPVIIPDLFVVEPLNLVGGERLTDTGRQAGRQRGKLVEKEKLWDESRDQLDKMAG